MTKARASVLLIGTALLFAALLAGCIGGGENAEQPPATQPSGEEGGGTQELAEGGGQKQAGENALSINDPGLTEVYEASSEPEPPKTALDNLDGAFAEGRLGKEDYIFYSLQAIFEPEALPSEYAGEPLQGYDVSDEIMLAVENWDSLSEETKQKLRPWVFNPDETGVTEVDIENAGLEPENKLSFSRAKASFNGGYNLYAMIAIPGKVKIKAWMPANSSQADLQKIANEMKVVKQAMIDAWDKYKNVFNFEPSNEVWFFVKKLPAGVRGSASIYSTTQDPADRCRLGVDTNNTGEDKQTKSTSVHELFHCYQYNIPFRDFSNKEHKWLREATAKWSEHFIYPDYNKEHQFLNKFFKTRHWKWVNWQNYKYYADYPFFQFLQQTRGEDAVVKVLKDAKTKGVKGALKAISEYEDNHAEYSVWNWNKDPILRYKDAPDFPSQSIEGGALIAGKLSQVNEYTMRFSMQPGAASYHAFEVSNPDIRKIKFKFQDKDNKVQQRRALIKIGDVWTEEYWSPLEEKTFCLNKPHEKVSQIVVVYSNSDLDNAKEFTYEIDTTGECPFEISGTTKITLFSSGGVVKKITGTLGSNDVLEYYEGEYGDSYRIKERSMTCSYSEQSIMDFGEYGVTRMSRGGGGSTTETYTDLEEAPFKIRFDYDDNEIDFAVDPDKQKYDWVLYSVSSVTKIPGAATSSDSWTEQEDCMVYPGDPYYLELDMAEYFDGQRLKGGKTFTSHEGTTTIRVEFDYILSEET